jgi:hypothetical protein
MAASVALREAIDCAEHLGFGVPDEWRSMADGLVLPVNNRNVILDHDGFTRREEKAATPAALAGLFPLGYRVSDEVKEATIRFYLDMADDYVGAPMLSALLGTWAAMLGDRARAGRLFEEGYGAFTTDRFNVMHEYRPDKFPDQPISGPFLANAGGLLIGCLYGLTGIRLGPGPVESWCERPAVMPDLWDGVEVERLWARGQAVSLHAKHGDGAATIAPL